MRKITAMQLIRVGFDRRFSFTEANDLADLGYNTFFRLVDEHIIEHFGDSTYYITRKGWELIEEAYEVCDY